MSVKVADVMAPVVFMADPKSTVGDVRDLMETQGIGAVPVVDDDGRPVGILTATDLVSGFPPEMPVTRVMNKPVHTIKSGAGVSEAARKMLVDQIHHLIVSDEKKIVGIVSSFDLLRLVEGRRFESKE